MRLLFGLAVIAVLAKAQSASSDAHLNSLDLNLSQYNARMGLSTWFFNQNMAQMGMGDGEEIVARGRRRLQSGQADVNYRPVSETMADTFAASLSENDVSPLSGSRSRATTKFIRTGQSSTRSRNATLHASFREALLKDEYFQGTTDRYRQTRDESAAVQAVAALVEYRNGVKHGDRAVIGTKRQEALCWPNLSIWRLGMHSYATGAGLGRPGYTIVMRFRLNPDGTYRAGNASGRYEFDPNTLRIAWLDGEHHTLYSETVAEQLEGGKCGSRLGSASG